MPTIHREHGLNFVIYIDDHPPPHVHIAGRGVGKVMLEPDVTLVESRGLSRGDIRRALDVVLSQQGMMIEAWKRIHG